jgi:hypothetical protein
VPHVTTPPLLSPAVSKPQTDDRDTAPGPAPPGARWGTGPLGHFPNRGFSGPQGQRCGAGEGPGLAPPAALAGSVFPAAMVAQPAASAGKEMWRSGRNSLPPLGPAPPFPNAPGRRRQEECPARPAGLKPPRDRILQWPHRAMRQRVSCRELVVWNLPPGAAAERAPAPGQAAKQTSGRAAVPWMRQDGSSLSGCQGRMEGGNAIKRQGRISSLEGVAAPMEGPVATDNGGEGTWPHIPRCECCAQELRPVERIPAAEQRAAGRALTDGRAATSPCGASSHIVIIARPSRGPTASCRDRSPSDRASPPLSKYAPICGTPPAEALPSLRFPRARAGLA